MKNLIPKSIPIDSNTNQMTAYFTLEKCSVVVMMVVVLVMDYAVKVQGVTIHVFTRSSHVSSV